MARAKFRLKPETIELLSDVLIKIIGETVKSKILRAVLIALVAAGGTIMSNDEPPTAPSAPLTQIVNSSK